MKDEDVQGAVAGEAGETGEAAANAPWRDPVLGQLLREARTRKGVTAIGLADAAWKIHGIPLSAVEVHRVERAERHPTPWCIRAYLETLQPGRGAAEAIVHQWGTNPRYSDLGLTLDTWPTFLAAQTPPLPITRRAHPRHLTSPGQGVVDVALRTTFTTSEHGLLTRAARLCHVEPAALIRSALADAVRNRRLVPHRNPVAHGRSRTDRFMLSPSTLRVIEDLAGAHDLSAWVRSVVLDYIEAGRATADYAAADRRSRRS